VECVPTSSSSFSLTAGSPTLLLPFFCLGSAAVPVRPSFLCRHCSKGPVGSAFPSLPEVSRRCLPFPPFFAMDARQRDDLTVSPSFPSQLQDRSPLRERNRFSPGICMRSRTPIPLSPPFRFSEFPSRPSLTPGGSFFDFFFFIFRLKGLCFPRPFFFARPARRLPSPLNPLHSSAKVPAERV